ncbi:MAG: M13 family peptidase, partial [Caldisericaceae bacterium]|nr:M13 family peptidase [Caldisericaceae bacterium]
GKMYVARYFPPEAKQRMKILVQNLLDVYRERIEKLDWMGEQTKKQALAKLAKFNTKIGYPDQWKDYTTLDIKKDDLVGNIKRARLFEYYRNIDKLNKPVDRSEWFMNPQTVNAYYSASMNEIVFPAGILQPPFFDLEADDAVNYGAIGAVIGHEITHGFDDQGSKSDGDGNLRNWWTKEDRKNFEQRANRLVKQYSSYVVIDTIHLNGKLTLGENIADLGGLTIAYHAYQKSLNGKPAPELDGLTGDQRFFIGWAQIWRRKYRADELRRRLLTDPHSPSEFRVNGVVVNIPAFYQAFQVTEKDSLYLPPEQRVQIW